MPTTVTPIKSTTQIFTEIEDIDQDLVLISDGSCALVIETTAVNFSLLSEKEQEAMIYSYSGLLNSLSFPIQIYIRSKRKDVSGYLKKLEDAEHTQTNPILASRIKQYRQFITNTVKERKVLDKKFYVVIPFSNLELGVGNISALTGKKGLPYPKSYIFEKARNILLPKRDHMLRQLIRLGLKGTHLNTQRLVALFYDVYNQDASAKIQGSEAYTSALVQKVS